MQAVCKRPKNERHTSYYVKLKLLPFELANTETFKQHLLILQQKESMKNSMLSCSIHRTISIRSINISRHNLLYDLPYAVIVVHNIADITLRVYNAVPSLRSISLVRQKCIIRDIGITYITGWNDVYCM